MLEASIIEVGEDMTDLEKKELENMDIDSKEKCEKKYELFEKAIGKHQQMIIYLTGKQGEVLTKLKELCKKEGSSLAYYIYLDKFKLEKSNANLKIRIAELIKEFPKLQNTNLSLNVFNKYLKQIRSICKKSGEKYM